MNLLNKVELAKQPEQVDYISSKIKTDTIEKAGGNSLTNQSIEASLSVLRKMASDNELKIKNNSIVKAKIDLSEELKSLDAEYLEKGVDKYSKENFEEYTSRLSKIYENNKAKINDINGIDKHDVDTWDNYVGSVFNSKADNERVLKLQHDNKEIANQTILNVTALSNSYNTEKDENIAKELYTEMNNLIDNIPGITETEALKMKIEASSKAQSSRLEYQMNKIISNPNMSPSQKKQSLVDLQKSFDNGAVKANIVSDSEKVLFKTDEERETYINTVSGSVAEASLKADGLINRLQTQIENEEARKLRSEAISAAKIRKQFDNEYVKLQEALDSGDYLTAYRLSSGNKSATYDDMTAPNNVSKFFGADSGTILNNGKYIPSISQANVNTKLGQQRKALESGVSQFDVVQSTMSELPDTTWDMDGTINTDDREFTKRQYIANGLLNRTDVYLMESQDEDSARLIDARAYGDSSEGKQINKINIMQLGPKGNGKYVYESIRELEPKAQDNAIRMMAGLIRNNPEKYSNILTITPKGISTPEFVNAYNSNPQFKKDFDKCVEVSNNVDYTEYRPANINKDKVKSTFIKGYREKLNEPEELTEDEIF